MNGPSHPLKRRTSGEGSVSPPPLKRAQPSTTTSMHDPLFVTLAAEYSRFAGKAVASFFTPVSKKESAKVSWRIVEDTLLAALYSTDTTAASKTDSKTPRRVAAFDFVRYCFGNLFNVVWHPNMGFD